MIDSRDVKDLHPRVQALAQAFIAGCTAKGIKVIITSTYRDFACQDALYARGRTPESIARGEKIVTRARGGQSYHNFRVAFDFVPVINGKAVWSDISLFETCGGVARDLGLEWGGDWKRFRDRPHCQFRGGLTLKDFQAGKTLAA